MAEHDAVKTLDCKGLKCPMPIVKTSMEVPKMQPGQVLEVLSTDPGALNDFPAWARSTGNEILESRQEGTLIRIFIRRTK